MTFSQPKTPSDRYILVTGCSSGIGHCVAHGLAEHGYRVIATIRSANDTHSLIHNRIFPVIMDLNDPDSIEHGFIRALEISGGHIDALFSNAGYGQPGAVEDLSRAALRQQFETNVFGPLDLINRVLPVMRQQGYGRIIFNSSVLGMVSLPFRGAYNASKHAIESLADTLRNELYGTSIQVILIEPGPIKSRFRENAYAAFRRHIDAVNSPFQSYYTGVAQRLADAENANPFTLPPEAVLEKVLEAIESRRPKIRYYVTVPTWMFAVLRRCLPFRVMDLIIRQVAKSENRVQRDPHHPD